MSALDWVTLAILVGGVGGGVAILAYDYRRGPKDDEC